MSVKSISTQNSQFMNDNPPTVPQATAFGSDRGAIAALQVAMLTISPPLLLAPMAGVTHTALRQLVASFGGCGAFYTEMLSAKALPNEGPRKSLFLMRSPAEHPLVYQMVTADQQEILAAVETVERCGADAIDLNMGCAAPAVLRLGAGAALMRDGSRAAPLVAALRRATALPLLVKIRLGWHQDPRRLVDFCRLLEDAGADALVVHARLCGDRFKRPAHWAIIAAVKNALGIPVIGNGDVVDGSSARRMFAETGCDGIMIGRAAIAQPWIFRNLVQELWQGRPPDPPPVARAVFEHYLALLAKHFPPERRLGRLKEFTAYFARNFHYGHTLWKLVQGAPSLELAEQRAVAFLDVLEAEPLGGYRRRLSAELGRHG
jgi:tRNA-dihydrouridine synthase B